MKESLSPLSFAHLIAYLLPGIVFFYALTYVSPRVAEIFQALFDKDKTVGASVIMLVASVACGVFVSAVRGLLLDWIQEATGVQQPDTDYARLINTDIRQAFNDAIDNTYRYAQAYGNLAIALFVHLFLRHCIARTPIFPSWQLPLFEVIAISALFLCHRNQLRSTYKAIGDILKPSIEREKKT